VVLAVALALATTLVRQLGMVLPVVFGAACFAKEGLTRRTFAVSLVPFGLGAAALSLYERWLAATTGVPLQYHYGEKRLIAALTSGVVNETIFFSVNAATALVYTGAFLAPILPLLAPETRRARIAAAVWGGASLAISLLLLSAGRLMPLSGDVLYDFGMGPTTLHNAYGPGVHPFPRAPVGVWLVVTLAGVFGGGVLLWRVVTALVQFRDWRTFAAAAAFVVYMLPNALGGFFDRYFIYFVATGLLLLLAGRAGPAAARPAAPARPAAWLAAAVLVPVAWFSVAATHDYLAWNRARWQAISDLVNVDGAPRDHIDGGMEYNGLYFFSGYYTRVPGRSWWWVENDDYMVAFAPVEGYEALRRYPYPRWLTNDEGTVLALRKAP
jgi:hypothetical protein